MLLAVATGLTWSLGLVLTSKENAESVGAGQDTFVLSGAFLVLFSGVFWIWNGSALPTSASAGWCALGGLQSAIALLLFVPPLRTIGSTRTNMACSTIDPTLATVWAWLVFRKTPTFWAFIGGGCIVGILIVHGALLLVQERGWRRQGG